MDMFILLIEGLAIIGGLYLLRTVLKKYSPQLINFMNTNKKASIYSMFGIMLTSLIILIILRLNFTEDSYKAVNTLAKDIYQEVGVNNANQYKVKGQKQIQMEQLSRELKNPAVLNDSSKIKEIQLKFKNLKNEK